MKMKSSVLNLKIGDWVLIEKSGEIIPQVLQVIESKRTGDETEYEFPKNCPVCDRQSCVPKAKPLRDVRMKFVRQK